MMQHARAGPQQPVARQPMASRRAPTSHQPKATSQQCQAKLSQPRSASCSLRGMPRSTPGAGGTRGRRARARGRMRRYPSPTPPSPLVPPDPHARVPRPCSSCGRPGAPAPSAAAAASGALARERRRGQAVAAGAATEAPGGLWPELQGGRSRPRPVPRADVPRSGLPCNPVEPPPRGFRSGAAADTGAASGGECMQVLAQPHPDPGPSPVPHPCTPRPRSLIPTPSQSRPGCGSPGDGLRGS